MLGCSVHICCAKSLLLSPFLPRIITTATPITTPSTPIVPPTINPVLDDFDSDLLVSSSLSCPLAILVAEESVPSCRLVLPDTTADASAATAVPSRVDDSVTKATDAL